MLKSLIAAGAMLLVAATTTAQDAKKFEITPELQKQIDEWKATVARWAADPVVVQAVVEHNQKGPLAGMDNKKWATLRRRSAEVTQFQTNAAAKLLAGNQGSSHGIVSEAFLNGQKGEKVAFIDKTSSYFHAGKAKFDVPFQQHKSWQGAPEFDESTETYSLQVAVPVVQQTKVDGQDQPKEEVVGVLVVGLNLANLQAAKPAPAK